MNDTVRTMRGVLAFVILVAACGDDPSLRITVEHPELVDQNGDDLIVRTTIVVYESDNLRCTEVEFGDVSGSQLDGFEVARVETDATKTAGTFDGVFSRLGHKVIVARGFGASGDLVAAQCADFDEIVEHDSETIETIETVTVSVGAAEDGNRGVLVTTTDPLSRPSNNRPVSWRLYGAAGTSADPAKFTNVSDGIWEPRAPTCTSDGEAFIHPAPPKLPGGFAVQARVSWAAERAPLFTQFTPLATTESQSLDNSTLKPCAVRRSGTTRGVVCLETPTRAHEYTLTGSTLTRGAAQNLGDPAVGVVSIEQAGNLDVYAITTEGKWLAVSGAPAPGPGQWCLLGACSTFDLQVVPACGSSASFLIGKVGAVQATATLRTIALKGIGAPSLFRQNGDAISNAGCITELQSDGGTVIRQAVVIETGVAVGPPARVIFDCAANPAGCDNPLLNEGVGFTGGSEPRMIISTFDATGTVLSGVVARPNEKPNPATMLREDRFIERTRQPSAAPPTQLVVGQYDTDLQLDLLWQFSSAQARFSNVQIAYAREVDSAPITAILQTGGTMADLLTADLNNDGFDEAMFVIDKPGGERRLQVVPVGIPYPDPGQVPDDPACP